MGQYDLSEAEFMEKWGNQDKGKVIAMYEDDDGNWRGAMYKNGRFVQAREIGPETVLQVLLTHDGK